MPSPKLWVTPAYTSMLARMYSEYQSGDTTTVGYRWVQYLLARWQPGARVTDMGGFAAILYLMTGDPQYAQAAYTFLAAQPWFAADTGYPGGRDNFFTFNFYKICWVYDWCNAGWTSAQVSAFQSCLNTKVGYMLTGGERIPDTDLVLGLMFNILATDIMLGNSNLNGTILTVGGDNWNNPSGVIPVGGLDYSGGPALRGTLRDACYDAIQRMSAGGFHCYGSQYNLNDMRNVLLTWWAAKVHYGVDKFPEFGTQLKAFAQGFFFERAPDGVNTFQWGDTEAAGAPRMIYRTPDDMLFAGALDATNNPWAPYMQKLANEDVVNPVESNAGGSPIADFFLPPTNLYAPEKDWRTASGFVKGFAAPGFGVTMYHDGWLPKSSFFVSHHPLYTEADHHMHGGGDFRIFANEEWASPVPPGYGIMNGVTQNTNANGWLFCGLAGMRECQQLIDSEIVPGKYVMTRGGIGGQFEPKGYFHPPATAVHECQTTHFYVPSGGQGFDDLVVFARLDVEDPNVLGDVDRYEMFAGTTAIRAMIASFAGISPWMAAVHAWEDVVEDSGGFLWHTPRGQQVRLNVLAPQPFSGQLVAVSSLSKNVLPKFAHKQLRFWNPTPARLNNVVYTVHANPPAAYVDTLLSADGGTILGVDMGRPGGTDTVVLFSAIAANTPARTYYQAGYPADLSNGRLRSTGFSLAWTSLTNCTNIYVNDLDPAKSWTVVLDGVNKGVVPLSAANILRQRARGKNHTLILTPA